MDEARGIAWANPASVHGAGRASRALLELARDRIAKAIGAAPADVVLTGGGTEACNLGVIGSALAAGSGNANVGASSNAGSADSAANAAFDSKTDPLVVLATRIEHPAVSEALALLTSRFGFSIRWLDLPRGAAPALGAFEATLDPSAHRPVQSSSDRRADADHGRDAKAVLAVVQWVNHETGTVLPVAAYAQRCRALGIRVFVDATQALGKVPVDVEALGADYVAFASHKVGGPAGAGALWIRRGAPLESISLGGSQERGRRAGTPDVVAAIGFGAACEAIEARLADQPRIAKLRDRLETALLELGAQRNADASERVATVTNLWFPGQRSDVLVAALDVEGIAASSGAACSSGKSEPSPVLLAMHPAEPERATSSIRFSFGPQTTEDNIDFTIDCIRKIRARQRR
jgi:cysteine desulfurase